MKQAWLTELLLAPQVSSSVSPQKKPQPIITLCSTNVWRYYINIIKSFSCKETQKVFGRTFSKKLLQGVQTKARQKLVLIDAATELIDLRIPPGNRLEELKDDRKGQHSIRINDQGRICFVWKGGDAYEVEIVDYH
jgi:proteic killer suppression protein